MTTENEGEAAWERARQAEADYHKRAAELITVDEALARISRAIQQVNQIAPGGHPNDLPGHRHRRVAALLRDALSHLPDDARAELVWLITEPFDDGNRRLLRMWVDLHRRKKVRRRRQRMK
jgi:hypothetical protein